MGIFDGIISRLRSRRSAPVTERIGVAGTRIYSGIIDDGESSTDLSGTEKYKTYGNLMANVNIVGTAVRHTLNTVAKPGWILEPAEDGGARAQEISDTIQDMINNTKTPWHRIVRRAAMYRFYGFSIQEWTFYRREDGALGIWDIEPRPQQTIERWDADEFGDIEGIIQRAPKDGRLIYIPREKMVHMVDDSISDSPEGMGLFRHVIENARRLQRFEQLEGWGFENDLRGIPVGRAPLTEISNDADLTESQKAAIQAPIRNMIKNHVRNPALGILLDSETYRASGDNKNPSGTYKWDFSLLQGGSTSQEAIAKAIIRKTTEIARILGIEFLLLGADGTGSLAMSRDKSKNFGLMIDGILNEIAETYEVDVIDRIMQLNGWPMELKPTIKIEAIQHRDIEEIASTLEQLARAGAPLTPDDEAVNVMRDILGLPQPPEMDLSMSERDLEPDPEPNDEPELDEVIDDDDLDS